MSTLEQLRAKHVMSVVKGWDRTPWKKEAAKRVRDLPLMLRNSGLGQTLAILMKESVKRAESKEIVEVLSRWLLRDSPVKAYPSETGDQPERLLQVCFEGSRDRYQLAQQEAMAYLGWLKIIAEALVEV